MVYYRNSNRFAYKNHAISYCNAEVLKKLLNGNTIVKWCWDECELSPYNSIGKCDNTLVFESRFESGNLDMAIKVSDKEYLLLMQNDKNTKGNNQWFYFKVSNAAKNSTMCFKIANYVNS